MGVSLRGQPGAAPASRDSGSCPVPLPLGPGITCDPGVEPYPVALCGDVLSAVRDLGLAAVQDAPDDGNAGHLLPAADQVLWLLKGHYPAGCRGPGQRSGVRASVPSQLLPSLRPSPAQPSPDSRSLLIAPAPPHPGLLGEGRGRGWKIPPEKVEGLEQCQTDISEGSRHRKETTSGCSPRGGPKPREQVGKAVWMAGAMPCPPSRWVSGKVNPQFLPALMSLYPREAHSIPPSSKARRERRGGEYGVAAGGPSPLGL